MTAARCRRHRERQAEGRIVLSVEVNAVDVCDLLIGAGLLPTWDDHDRCAIERAVERLLAALAAERETRFEDPDPRGA
jgi:hypothetical protein